jgi:hypothetical protein
MADQTLIGKQLYTTVFTVTVNSPNDFAKVRTNTRFRSLHNDGIYFKDNNGFITSVNQGDFPILNQNTTGNAATATTAKTVTTNANLTGDVTSVGNVTTLADYINGVEIVVPTGNNQLTAYELTVYNNVIDSCDGIKGVILLSSIKKYRTIIRNNDPANGLLVYPFLGTNLMGTDLVPLAINAPLTIAAYGVFEFICYQDGEVRFY